MGWKTKKLNKKAQASIFDAVMFFIVMLIASTLIFVFSNQAFQTQEVVYREDMMGYAEETGVAIMQSTIYETWYDDINGNRIEKPPGSTNINDLLLEELALLDDGVPQKNFEEGYEKDIKTAVDKLIRSGYGYAMQAAYTNISSGITHEIFISSGESVPETDITTSQWSQPMVSTGKSGNAIIKLSVWRE